MIVSKIVELIKAIPEIIADYKHLSSNPQPQYLRIEAECSPLEKVGESNRELLIREVLEKEVVRLSKLLQLKVTSGGVAKKLNVCFYTDKTDCKLGFGSLYEPEDGSEKVLSVTLILSEEKAHSILERSTEVPLRFSFDIKTWESMRQFYFDVTDFSVEELSSESSKGQVLH